MIEPSSPGTLNGAALTPRWQRDFNKFGLPSAAAFDAPNAYSPATEAKSAGPHYRKYSSAVPFLPQKATFGIASQATSMTCRSR